MKEFWDNRYKSIDFTYGKEPNEYFKEKIDSLTPSTILFPAEGEGRNSVYAAKNNWQVSAFDMSFEGQKKALALAEENKVNIDYIVSEVEDIDFKNREFDCLVFIYSHFSGNKKKEYNQKLLKYLKIGGHIIFECFSKEQLNYTSGGPKDLSMLYSIDEVKSQFENVDFIELYEKKINLEEGEFHKGKGSVIRFFGIKKLL